MEKISPEKNTEKIGVYKTVLEGYYQNYEYLDKAKETITSRANIILGVELTIGGILLSFAQNVFNVDASNFFYAAISGLCLLYSIVNLVIVIFPRAYTFPFPSFKIDGDKYNDLTARNTAEFYKNTIKYCQRAIAENGQNQTFKARRYLHGVISFLIALAILTLLGANIVYVGNTNQPDIAPSCPIDDENTTCILEPQRLNYCQYRQIER